MRNRNLLLPFLTTAFIAIYFLWLTRDARHSYFTPDSCMTLYWAWDNSAGTLLKANLFFFSSWPFFRPMTVVWYRLVFDFAGFNPLLFHIASLVVLAANIWLTYCVSRRLTGSRETGALAALLVTYHGRFMPLYFDTGHSFDVTCYFFYFSTLLFYLRVRSRQRPLLWWEMVILSALYICAFNCKELAVTLPLVLVVYEWLYHRPSVDSLRSLWRWLMTGGRALPVMAVLTLLFAIGRVRSQELANAAFQPVFSWDRFMSTSRPFVSELLAQKKTLPATVILLIWLSLFVIAWATRSRALKFAWMFIMLSVIPVAFIMPRGPAQHYIPYFGWVLYAATALVEGTKWLFPKLHASRGLAEARHVVVFLGAACVMFWVSTQTSWAEVWNVSLEGEENRSIVEQLHRLQPVLRPHSRVLFLDDPVDDDWQLMYLVRLSYANHDVQIDRAKVMKPPPSAAEIASYDYVFDYLLGRFYTSAQLRKQGPQPVLAFEFGAPVVFHDDDGTRVTRWNPTRPGEHVFSLMTDLGATQPPVPKDQPFPGSPFLEVASPVQVRVDGVPAEILLKIGWPNRVNQYRVDFRIPENVRSEPALVEVTAGGITGPPVLLAFSGRR